MPNIDALTIQIDGQADGASKSLEKLTKTLQRLEKSANGGAGLQAVNTKLASIQAQINKINTGKFGEVVKKLDSLGKTKVDTALTKSVGNTAARLGIMAISLRTVSNLIGGAVKNSLNYMENMNLFTVSMGKYADEAERYAQSVSEIMGIDMSAWIRNQGVFMALTEGFGVVSDRAYTMSKNLTQLGYDLSSFYNLSIEDAFQKLQSGIAGELEPLVLAA